MGNVKSIKWFWFQIWNRGKRGGELVLFGEKPLMKSTHD
jgi:hypothetical protein